MLPPLLLDLSQITELTPELYLLTLKTKKKYTGIIKMQTWKFAQVHKYF